MSSSNNSRPFIKNQKKDLKSRQFTNVKYLMYNLAKTEFHKTAVGWDINLYINFMVNIQLIKYICIEYVCTNTNTT